LAKGKRQKGIIRTAVIENGAGTFRIPPFGLSGGNTVKKILQPSAKTADLTRRGKSDVKVAFSIIPNFLTV